MPASYLMLLHHADGTLAERVALGKRRREQLGIQTDLDMQNSSSAAGQSAGPLPFSHGAPNRALAGPLTGPSGGTGPSGRAAGPAEGMMAKWGYTPGEVWLCPDLLTFLQNSCRWNPECT